MGRGNVRVTEPYEGLFYIRNEDMQYYRKKDSDAEDDVVLLRDIPDAELANYDYDELGSDLRFDDVFWNLTQSISKRFPCFFECREFVTSDRLAFLESKLFYICREYNEWSTAIELIQKESAYGDGALEGLQKRHYRRFLDGIRDALFEQFDSVCVRTSAWTSGTIRRQDFENGGMKDAG